jgi:signal transduction histidine kinase
VHIPRITWRNSPEILEKLAGNWVVRYSTAVVMVLLSAALSLLLGDDLGVELYLGLLFATVFAASVTGGLGPGLLATVLAAGIGYEVPRRSLSLDEVRLLAIEAALLSIGGTLRAGLIKAGERLKTNVQVEQQILEIGDEERRRIGRDLHDGLGQHLTGISMHSETMAQQLAAGGNPNLAHAEKITQLVSEAIGITRDLAKSLSPITLEIEGLSAALGELAETCRSLFGVHCTFECDGQDLPLDQKRRLHVFRLVQEAVNNSVRHGKAKNIRVGVACEGHSIRVTVVDDGIGLSEETTSHPGVGLRIMQQRARVLGATLTAERATPDGGTVVTCICPLDGNAGS